MTAVVDHPNGTERSLLNRRIRIFHSNQPDPGTRAILSLDLFRVADAVLVVSHNFPASHNIFLEASKRKTIGAHHNLDHSVAIVL